MTGDEPRANSERPRRRADRSATDIDPIIGTVVDEVSPGRALDVATGTGRNALALAERGWTVDAVDLSSAQLSQARDRAAERSLSVNWILADVDCYCLPTDVYDLVTVSFFDARDRLSALIDALAPGGLLCYEHYLEAPAGEHGAGDRYRFEPNELLAACSDLTILYYAEHRADGQPLVTLVARDEDAARRWRPRLQRPP